MATPRGLEISDRKIRLMRWSGSLGKTDRRVPRESGLAGVFANCQSAAERADEE